MSRGPLTCLYLGEAALMVAIPHDVLTELVEAAWEAIHDRETSTDAAMRLESAVHAVEELEQS